MSFYKRILIFVGLICLISAAPTHNRQKRQTIYFEDELDDHGFPKPGSWNQNQPKWDEFKDDENDDDGPNWDDWGSWFGNGQNNNGPRNDNRTPTGNGGNDRAWKNGNDQNWNGNNGDFGNFIAPSNNKYPQPSGNYHQKILPPIALTGARPPSTPRPSCDCPATQETNYVCGTDGFTYINPSLLRCARVCGANVQMQHYGACTRIPPTDLRWG